MIAATDLKRGSWIELDGEPWVVTDITRQTPSARGASLLVKARVRNARTGLVQDRSFKGGDKLTEPNVEKRPIQYLFREGSAFHFMDQESYEQFSLTGEELGDQALYLIDNLELAAMLLDGHPIGIELPAHVELRVTDCPPPAKGVAGNNTKVATLETGLSLQVPPYLEQGELVRVDTRDGRFVQRVKE